MTVETRKLLIGLSIATLVVFSLCALICVSMVWTFPRSGVPIRSQSSS